MAQYQSFPDATGASRTLDKLKSLALPDLSGRSFLDVGCNEGFFCGFAKFLGAERSVGLDKSALFLDRARQRFPTCEFLLQDWNTLPDGKFDVILLASALHYADDQGQLIARLVDKLTDDGTLVLEMGIASASGSAWIEVDRGIDRRSFPTMAKLREILGDFAWKWMGRSVSQAGDPVSRHVVHVSRRRPVAYLLLQPPGYGKSSLASRLFGPLEVPVVSGDQAIAAVAQGDASVAPELLDAIAKDYSPFRIDQVIQRVFEQGLGEALIDLWLRPCGGGDFALDVFVPMDCHAAVEAALSRRGYLPVRLQWDRIGPPLLPAAAIVEQAEHFYASMEGVVLEAMAIGKGSPSLVRGFVDELRFESGQLVVRGWAVDQQGNLPDAFELHVAGRRLPVTVFERQARKDVQRHLRLAHALVGFRAGIEVAGVAGPQDMATDFALVVPGRGPLRLNGRVQRMLAPRPAA